MGNDEKGRQSAYLLHNIYPDKKNYKSGYTQIDSGREQHDINLIWEPHGKLDIKSYKLRIWKNIIVLGTVFMLNFLSFGGLSSLQSSLFIEHGMGTTCSAILYVALVISCLFLPKVFIYWLGHKWIVTLSLISYILWMFANGFGVWASMVPSSIIVGICSGPLWTAKSAYYTKLGKQYAAITDQEESSVIALFFGIFFMFSRLSFIFGNLISTIILWPSVPSNASDPGDDNITFCGMHYCPANSLNITYLDKTPKNLLYNALIYYRHVWAKATGASNRFYTLEHFMCVKMVWTLCTVYIVIAFIGLSISAVFLDNLPKSLESNYNSDKPICKETLEMIGSSIRHMGNVKQLLLIPITIYAGLEQAFKGADLTKSWITCSFGIWMVGLMNIPMGIADAGASLTSGRLVKYIGRLPFIIIGLIVDTSLQLTLSFWEINQGKPAVLYIISSFWGASNGLWATQINAFYGVVFMDSIDEAFSNFKMWESLGYIIGFGYSSVLCTSVKLYILSTLLWIGTICYFIVEWIHKCKTDK